MDILYDDMAPTERAAKKGKAIGVVVEKHWGKSVSCLKSLMT